MNILGKEEVELSKDILLEKIKEIDNSNSAIVKSIIDKLSNSSENLTEKERNILSESFSRRLLRNWSICDMTGMGSFEYTKATDECGVIHSISRKLMLGFPEHIASRF